MLRVFPAIFPLRVTLLISLVISSLYTVTSNATPHVIDFDHEPEAHTLHIESKSVTVAAQTYQDQTFKDGLGREAYLRGWNVSGSVKLVDTGFKPFKTTIEAARAFDLMRQQVGSNYVRFTIGWEGVHPQVDQIDYDYLDAVIAQMKEAIRNQIYLFIDYHQDLYSRHLFHADSQHTGNGAPAWITPPEDYPTENCGPVCFAWGQNNLTNPALRLAYQNFWNNAAITTLAGQRHVQDEFLWQFEKMVQYVKSQLTEEQFQYVLGVQPMNEPIHGTAHLASAESFDNDKLWPFYKKTRAILLKNGWQDKWIYAEPLVFWDTNAGFFAPATGGGYLKEQPGNGFVFAPHFYDAARFGISNLSLVQNGDYFKNLDRIREEARFLNLPMTLGEFGTPIEQKYSRDSVRIIKGTYQGMELSDIEQAEKTRYTDLYTTSVSGTQWHWDTNHDNHQEYMNGNPNKLITDGDAWNEEDFSVIRYTEDYNIDPFVVERAYPRRSQGNLVGFYFNDIPNDSAHRAVSWSAIRPDESTTYFKNHEYLWVVWQGRHSEAPTELYLPRRFSPQNLIVITEEQIRERNLTSNAQVTNDLNEILLVSDLTQHRSPNQHTETGHRLLIWDDGENDENGESLHFALVVNAPEVTGADLVSLQTALKTRVLQNHKSPIYLTGKMVGSDYPEDESDTFAFDLMENIRAFWIFRYIKLEWSGAQGPVVILRNNAVVETGYANGSDYFWSIGNRRDEFQICEQADATACSRIIKIN